MREQRKLEEQAAKLRAENEAVVAELRYAYVEIKTQAREVVCVDVDACVRQAFVRSCVVYVAKLPNPCRAAPFSARLLAVGLRGLRCALKLKLRRGAGLGVRSDVAGTGGDGDGDGFICLLPELSSCLACCRQKLAAESAEAVKRENESALSVAAEGHAAAMKR